MASDAALRHLTIGQYVPKDSIVHRLDPRTKLVALGVLAVSAVVASSYPTILVLLLAIWVAARLARLPMRYLLANMAPLWPVIAVLASMQLLFYSSAFSNAGAKTLLTWGPVWITTASVRAVAATIARFVILFALAGLFTATTTPSAITHGLERLLAPWGRIGLPAHELALIGAIALRFLPILGEQMETIQKAQASRCISSGSPSRWQFLANARRLANLVVPLFVDAYHCAEELMLAMQARCYRGGRGRTHLVELRFTSADYLAFGVLIFLAALTIGIG